MIRSPSPFQSEATKTLEEGNVEPCAIIGSKVMDMKTFMSKVVPILSEKMENPRVVFLVSDEPGCSLHAVKFLCSRGFRNVLIYHCGHAPSHSIGKYERRGGFDSASHMEAQMLQDATEVLNF